MAASSAAPESRNDCSAAGMRSSGKAKRSRRLTGEEWWLRPMRTRDIARGGRRRPPCGKAGTEVVKSLNDCIAESLNRRCCFRTKNSPEIARLRDIALQRPDARLGRGVRGGAARAPTAREPEVAL